MLDQIVLRCAGGCRRRMTEEEVNAHVAVVCLTVDEADVLTGSITLAVCSDCAAKGGKERAEIAVLNARSKLANRR